MPPFRKSSQPVVPRGFTLIELMIVVTIAAILSSIALPTYRNYVIEACRIDAKSALEKVANKQEQYYFDFNAYAGNITSLPISATSPEGHYRLETLLISDSNTYRATAKQDPDDTCLPENDIQYRIDHTGLRQHKVYGGSWDSLWN